MGHFHVPHFVDHQSAVKLYGVVSLHISNVYAQKKCIDKKLVLTLRAILISQEVDLWLQAISMVLRGD